MTTTNTDLAHFLPPIAESKVMKNVLLLVERFAKTRIPIFLFGEQGTGKSYLAQYIHSQSRYENASFINVNAKTIDSGDLYKYSQKQNTVYIDDFQFFPADCQQELSESLLSKNIRLIISAEKSLEELVNFSALSTTLYTQLSLSPIFIPPLRERMADIPFFAQFFIQKYSRIFNKNFSGLSKLSLSMICDSYWEKNIPQLESCIAQACEQESPPYIEKINLYLNMSSKSDIVVASDKTLRSVIEQFKKEYIIKILTETRWNQTEAAKILDVQRTYLSRLIKELKL
ncbi:MAG: sigma 54-interacting transcriptional regulator [Treponemataceae bacterium]